MFPMVHLIITFPPPFALVDKDVLGPGRMLETVVHAEVPPCAVTPGATFGPQFDTSILKLPLKIAPATGLAPDVLIAEICNPSHDGPDARKELQGFL
jgi:hypothetical protein